ncbi:MAG: S-ribosylhomocysteine lyase [Clostridia bacterium]|nr:S-ribosylhomocysteine lyase [Clostridia bacterium]
MDKIASFKVNHLNLMAGLYVSRRDMCGATAVTTFDLRFTMPNREPVMDMPAVHTIEHLGATYLRNCKIKDKVIYFGPMGCRTGFYAIFFGDLAPQDVYGYILDMCTFICGYQGDIPGAKPEECGNYSEQNLAMAKYYVKHYKSELEEHKRFEYPL